jgi:hypothetical protein
MPPPPRASRDLNSRLNSPSPSPHQGIAQVLQKIRHLCYVWRALGGASCRSLTPGYPNPADANTEGCAETSRPGRLCVLSAQQRLREAPLQAA